MEVGTGVAASGRDGSFDLLFLFTIFAALDPTGGAGMPAGFAAA
jgi:hypothetical protein